MSRFENLKQFYTWGYATKEQLQRYITLGALTEEQYEEILNSEPVDPLMMEIEEDPIEEEPLEDEDGDYPINPS